MRESIVLEIGGVRFGIACPDSHLLPLSDPSYNPFISVSKEELLDADIKIHLLPGQVPCLDEDLNIFRCESWSMYKNNKKYDLTYQPPALQGEAFWVARFERDVKQVTVYCNEKFKSDQDGKIAISNPVCYPLDQLLLMYHLALRGGILLHAAGIDIQGKGLIFPGRSGAGKSTLTRQFAAQRSKGLISDDRVVVRKMNGRFKIFGTPWPGEAGVAVNTSVQLSGIFFIQHGSDNRTEEISSRRALEMLLPVTSIPWYDNDIMPNILGFCEDLVSNIPTYELHFKPNGDVVDFLEKFIVE